MSDAGASIPQPRPARARPGWLRWLLGRSDANAGSPSNRDLRLIETAILIVAGLVLAVATANDIGRAVHITERIKVDQHSYRVYMHTKGGVTTPIRKVSITPAVYGKRDTACSPPIGTAHGSACLMLDGPAAGTGPRRVRTVVGGFRLLPNARNRFGARYACFGLAAQLRLCGAQPPP